MANNSLYYEFDQIHQIAAGISMIPGDLSHDSLQMLHTSPNDYPDAPWCWNIYLHFPQKWPKNDPHVGKYSSTMGHQGYILPYLDVCWS